MRKVIAAQAVLLTASLALAGCMSPNTGDVGQKNIRPYYANDYDKQGIRINGVHSPDSPIYRTRFASDQSNERNRWMGRDGLGNNIVGRHDNYAIEMNERVAHQLAAMPEVDSAYVVLADQSAYVGIIESNTVNRQLAASTELNNRLKDKVADRVKSMSPRIQNVYVTANPDFINRLGGYTQAAREGQPVQGFLAEFNALVERVFPGNYGRSGTAGNGTDLSNDTGTDTGIERGDSFTGNYRVR